MFRAEVSFPKWMLFLFKPFIVCGYWDERWCDSISDQIEDGHYETARIMLQAHEDKHGVSSQTIRLQTRMDHYELLSEKED